MAIRHAYLRFYPKNKRVDIAELLDDWQPARCPVVLTPLSLVPTARQDLRNFLLSDNDTKIYFDLWQQNRSGISPQFPRKSFLRRCPVHEYKQLKTYPTLNMCRFKLTASISLRAFHLSWGAFTSLAVCMVLLSQLVHTRSPCNRSNFSFLFFPSISSSPLHAFSYLYILTSDIVS